MDNIGGLVEILETKPTRFQGVSQMFGKKEEPTEQDKEEVQYDW
jgi:hypothetical protein